MPSPPQNTRWSVLGEVFGPSDADARGEGRWEQRRAGRGRGEEANAPEGVADDEEADVDVLRVGQDRVRLHLDHLAGGEDDLAAVELLLRDGDVGKQRGRKERGRWSRRSSAVADGPADSGGGPRASKQTDQLGLVDHEDRGVGLEVDPGGTFDGLAWEGAKGGGGSGPGGHLRRTKFRRGPQLERRRARARSWAALPATVRTHLETLEGDVSLVRETEADDVEHGRYEEEGDRR